ncbi:MULTISPECIES: MFS transporter [unclassified Butyrivibrio]|uniref:MFS transporter n=1 Tax=unclassified Butyrivibrio TaxID=2639466 RepID=UPI000400C353|nr:MULTISPECIES: MFS transporter [unclassified Butyrivibrio]
MEKDNNTNSNPLWTRDFTIITLGSVVSMFGNGMAGFAMSLMVLDYTGSTMLYAIYLSMYTIPQLIMPIISGAILDRFSRKKMIYTLDYAMSVIYIIVAIAIWRGLFNFPLFAVMTFLLGCISSIYMVAYDSFYPLLITKGNYSKAYSIASVLETLSQFMVPLATFFYNLVGIAPLMIVNGISFFIAASLEMQIQTEEKYIEKQRAEITDQNLGKIARVLTDIREGFKYLISEKGLRAIAIYFLFSAMAGGAMNVIGLPYFKSNYNYGEYIFIAVFGMSFVGRAVGGLYHYRHRLPARYKYSIALFVYVMIGIFEGAFLYLPFYIAMLLSFMVGILGVTSYTIRISSTQSYVPDEKKGRFNGAFQVLSTSGALVAELSAGALSMFMGQREIVLLFEVLGVAAALILIGGNKKYVEKIYNRNM